MQSIPLGLIEPFNAPVAKRIPRLKRPQKLDENGSIIKKNYQVRYFDLDANHHVNNARYFDWLLDPLGRVFRFINTKIDLIRAYSIWCSLSVIQKSRTAKKRL